MGFAAYPLRLLTSYSSRQLRVCSVLPTASCSNILGGFAGVTSDANTLVNYARNTCQNVLQRYDDDIPVEHLTQFMCDLKQGYTQYGGLRPFGVSILYAGWDAHHDFQLYHSDPSGNYSGWKATCIGANNGTATSLLKQDYKEGCSIQDAMSLACKVLSKTMDSTALDSDKSESQQCGGNDSIYSPRAHARIHASSPPCPFQSSSHT